MVQILHYISSLCTLKNNSSLKKALGDTLDLFRSLSEVIGVTFAEKCYQLLLRVPKGRVTTYKDLAEAMGTRAYRAVGQAMNRNPMLIEVPCHRVVCRDGEVGGYALGVEKKIELLQKEGVVIKGNRVEGMEGILYRFSSQ
jgi:methylated-DNA-[protein]-cysteine S-methyltransferase